jgi:hypothetical protein
MNNNIANFKTVHSLEKLTRSRTNVAINNENVRQRDQKVR